MSYFMISHLHDWKGWKGEELCHPQLKVEAKAVEKGPDVNQFTRAQPQGGDSESADGCKEFFKDFVVVLTNIVINISATFQHRFNTFAKIWTPEGPVKSKQLPAKPVIDAPVKVPAKYRFISA